jgi:hypothetical protein
MAFEKGNKPHHGWPKGVSGNPGGRPKVMIEVAHAARERTLEAIETLTNIMRSEKAPAAARVTASMALLDRGWGRAPQTIDLRRTTELGDLSDAELIAIAAGGEVVGETNGSGVAPEAPSSEGKPH